jgi:hypothetical protein
MNCKSARLALAVIACVLAIEFAAAQGTPDPWYGRQARPQNMDPPKVFTGYFSIELPKDWQLAPGHTGTLFSLVQKTRRWEPGALITLEYMRLQAPLDPSTIAFVSKRELEQVQMRELSGKQFSSSVKTGALGPVIFIQYLRPALSGGDDHVVQYSMPIGTTLYRLICVAPATTMEKFRPTFAHVAASFTPAKPAG